MIIEFNGISPDVSPSVFTANGSKIIANAEYYSELAKKYKKE